MIHSMLKTHSQSGFLVYIINTSRRISFDTYIFLSRKKMNKENEKVNGKMMVQ